MNRQRKLDIIIAHNEGFQWFEDEVDAYEAQKIIDNEKVRIMQERSAEWNSGSPAEKKAKYAAIRKSLDEKKVEEKEVE